MTSKPRVKDTLKRLGLKIDLNRRKDNPPVPRLDRLLEAIDRLKHTYGHLGLGDLKSSHAVRANIQSLFDKYGIDLWPPPGVNTSAWLFDASVDDCDELYPRNLHYCNNQDQISLRQNFNDLLNAKIDHYHIHQQRLRRVGMSLSAPGHETGPKLWDIIEISSEEIEHSDCDSNYTEPLTPRHGFSCPVSRPRSTSSENAHSQMDVPVARMVTSPSPARLDHRHDDQPRNSGQCDTIQVGGNGRISECHSGRLAYVEPFTERQPNNSSGTMSGPAPSRKNLSCAEISAQKHARDPIPEESPGRRVAKRSKVYSTSDRQPALIVRLKLTAQKLATIDWSTIRQDHDAFTRDDDHSLSERHNIASEHSMHRSSTTIPAPRGKTRMSPFDESPVNCQPQSDNEPVSRRPASSQNISGLLSPSSATPLRVKERSGSHMMRHCGKYPEVADPISGTDSASSDRHEPRMGSERPVHGGISSAVAAEAPNLTQNATVVHRGQNLVHHYGGSSTAGPSQKDVVMATDKLLPCSQPRIHPSTDSQPASEVAGLAGTHFDQGDVDEEDNALTDLDMFKVEEDDGMTSSVPSSQPEDGLEQAEVLVWWPDRDEECPDFVNLQRCESYTDVFAQLKRDLPEDLEGRRIKAARVVLTNAQAAGIVESPNVHMVEVDGAAAFRHLTNVLKQYTPHVMPKLELTVELWK